MKKRIISVLLVTAMILSCGCKKKEKEESSESTESTTESTTEKTESVTEPSPLVTDTEPEEFAFDKTNIPGIQFCYSTASMAISAYSVLLDISRHEASELILDKGFNATYDYGESGVALLPAICLDDSFETETFAYDALVFIVNKDNPVSSISKEDLQKIYKGEITNWKEIGGNDQKIAAFEEGKEDTAARLVETMVTSGETTVDSPYIRVPGDDYAVWTARCSYDNSENAIGYIQYSSLTGSHMENEVKILKIDDIEPSKEMIRSGEYPFRFPLDVAIEKNLPATDPAWTLFHWLTGEDGRKLAGMAGYIVPDTAPAGNPDVPVSAQWSAFQEIAKEPEVFTRLKEERITDFVPSSDYGAVIPFLGVDNETNFVEGQKLYGLMDQNGRIICDPVFDDAYYLEDGSLVVIKRVVGSSDDLTDYRIGLISKDGSHNTGLIYDSGSVYNIRSNGEFYKTEKNGITLYKYDPSTGQVGSGKFLKMSDMEKMYCFEGINSDRYIRCADYFDDNFSLFDGATGEDIVPSLDSKFDSWSILGNFILGREKDAPGKNTKAIYSFDGKALSDNCYLNSNNLWGTDYMMLARTESKDPGITDDLSHYDYWDLVDKDGKVLTTIENKSHGIEDIRCVNETLLVKYSNAIELYDFSGKLLKTVDHKWPDLICTPEFPSGTHDDWLKSEKVPMVVYSSYNETKLYNLETGASAEFGEEYYVEYAGENILLTGKEAENLRWKLLDGSNLTLITEGESFIGVSKDYADGKFYLVSTLGEGAYAYELQVFDAATGEKILEKKADSIRGFIRLERIHAGKAVFNKMQLAGCEWSYVCDEVTVEDLSGNVLLSYHTLPDPKK